MEIQEFQKDLKDHVSKDNLDAVLDAIIKFSHDKNEYADIEKSAIINRNKLDRIEREKNDISMEEYGVGRSQITEIILTLIDEIDDAKPIEIPTIVSKEDKAVQDADQKEKIEAIIANNDKIFVKIILAALGISVTLFAFFIFQSNWGGVGASFSSAAGTCFIYLNNKKQMLQSLQVSA